MKGISAFKKFLVGSTGEKNWLFWMDIERAKFISDQTQLSKCVLMICLICYSSLLFSEAMVYLKSDKSIIILKMQYIMFTFEKSF